LCHPKRTLLVGGELVCAFTGEYASEHQIVHLELPTMHRPLVIASEHRTVSCILESYLPSSLIDKDDIITLELVLGDFVVCLDMGGDHGDFRVDTMLLQAVIGACLETLEYFCIYPLDFSIAFWMRNIRITDLDAEVFTVLLKHPVGELGPVVSDDLVQDPKPD
jgi:hypothetical protein